MIPVVVVTVGKDVLLLPGKFDTMEICSFHLTAMVYCCVCVVMATPIGLRQRFIVGKAEERDSQHFIRTFQQVHV